ncbi:MAG: ankyrin repeat domain-containing protein [Saprospiraceae bacterium]|nr:ankyrin repeat domain-containing protein [Saprospiraceae bacterium]
MPRTHSFPILLMSDFTDYWDNKATLFGKDLAEQKASLDDDLGHINLSKRYVKKMIVSEFKNFPRKPEFLASTWHYLNSESGKFHNEAHLPQAHYALEVTDPKWIEHIPLGAVWETTACDLIGSYWELESLVPSEKFYRLYRSMTGQWITEYGKKGTTGNRQVMRPTNLLGASNKVKEKLKKGYALCYQNFDTDWQIERNLIRAVEDQKREAERHPLSDQIIKAIRKQDKETVEKLMEADIDPNSIKTNIGTYALSIAAKGFKANSDSYQITKLLLDRGADPNIGNYGSFFPGLIYANWNNPWQEKIIELLLDYGVDISLIGGADQHSTLQTAAVSGRKDLLKRCIDLGMDVMHRSKQGHTALHYAAQNERDSIEIIDMLLEAGADINDNNGTWGTPLHFAAREGSLKIISHLIAHGADVHLRDAEGRQPIYLAARYGSMETLKAMLSSGAGILLESTEGDQMIGAILGILLTTNTELTINNLKKLTLLSKYIDISQLDGESLTDQLFKKAKAKNSLEPEVEQVLIDLIKLGFNPYWQDSKRFNLLHFAAKTCSMQLLKVVLTYAGGDVNLQDEFGWTAMHYAKATKNTALMDLMLSSGNSFDLEIPSKKKKKLFGDTYLRGTVAREMGG